jgi:hypothetical protein
MEVVMTRLGIVLAVFPAFLLGANVAGKWEVQVEGYGAPRTQKFELKQKGDELSGIYSGKFGESKVTGKVKDDAIEFEMRVIEDEHIVTVHYKGVASEDAIKGTVTFGDLGKGTWVASRGTTAHKK